MLFNSIEFLVFFPVVTITYFVLPHRWRWALLLMASSIFYMAFVPHYILILLTTIIVDYIAAIKIEQSTGHKKKLYLYLSIVTTCLILFIFKYFNFFNDNVVAALQWFNLQPTTLHWNVLLPIGLSFHTFQSLSYIIEVYRGKQKAERHFGIYALYVMFYPQLVAGPIERPQNLLHQFREPHRFDYQRVTDGLKLMLWGFFKKICVADRMAIIVNAVYTTPTEVHGPYFLIATIAFAFQIYADFSGYSDIAIGSAQVMGFKLMDNFNRPYYSKSIAEFWRRWHISLSTWFKDYIYIPLGGSRVRPLIWARNTLIVFLLSGLWHGANWTFIIWGALHGCYIIVGRYTQPLRERLVNVLGLRRLPTLLKSMQVVSTFSLVCFAWIFFRAASITDAWYVVTHLFASWGAGWFQWSWELNVNVFYNIVRNLGLTRADLKITVSMLLLMELVHLLQRHGGIRTMLRHQPALLRWSVYYALLIAVLYFGTATENQFIYFQF